MFLGICCLVVCIFWTPLAVEGWFIPGPRQSVCHGDWGCFSMQFPFNNTGYLPQPPSQLGVQFFLHTRRVASKSSSYQRSQISLEWSAERMREIFEVTKDTRVVVHGYLDHGNRPWIHRLVQRLLDRADQNVIVLDWARGATSINYLQVAANTRLVATMLAALLRKLMDIGAQPSSFHLIGFSLGAQIAGYTGSQIAGIGRITGLDPAGPAFENTTASVHLDPSDALFVDVIHTNALPFSDMGFGYIKPCGTVDFYPNGGQNQPGCSTSFWGHVFGIFTHSSVQEVIGCNHLRAVDYFLDSINPQCQLLGTPCPFPHVLSSLSCNISAHELRQCHDCPTLGYDIDSNASGIYYVPTRAQAPFCV